MFQVSPQSDAGSSQALHRSLDRWTSAVGEGRRLASLARSTSGLRVAAVAAWEVQSQLSTIVLISLLVLTSVWLAFPVMLFWALMATVVYFRARQIGLPDLLKQQEAKQGTPWGVVWSIPLTLGRIWLTGVQPFLYSRTFCCILNRPTLRFRERLAKALVLTLGSILFGVTANHHMLERAGFEDQQLLRLSLLGSALNVVYRVLLSALFVGMASGLFDEVPI